MYSHHFTCTGTHLCVHVHLSHTEKLLVGRTLGDLVSGHFRVVVNKFKVVFS